MSGSSYEEAMKKGLEEMMGRLRDAYCELPDPPPGQHYELETVSTDSGDRAVRFVLKEDVPKLADE